MIRKKPEYCAKMNGSFDKDVMTLGGIGTVISWILRVRLEIRLTFGRHLRD